MGAMMSIRGKGHKASFVLSGMQGQQNNFTIDSRPLRRMIGLLPCHSTQGKSPRCPTQENLEAEAGKTKA